MTDWLRLARAGYHLAPIRVRRGPDGRKRTNYLTRWGETATTDEDTILRWLDQYGDTVGFLIACQPSGIVVPDLDMKPGIDALAWWASEGLPVSPMCVDTPSGGQHHYWRQHPDQPIPNSTAAIAPGVDVRGVGGEHGGLVHAPGTIVLDGEPGEMYRMLDALIPAAELPVIPDEIIERIPEPRRRRTLTRAGSSAQGRAHQLSWVRAEVTRLRDVVTNNPAAAGQGHRADLMGAALMTGRLRVATDGPREAAENYLRAAVTKVWGRVDDEDEEWIQVGLDDGEADPYTIEPEDEEAHEPDVDPDAYAARIARLTAARLESLTVDQEARRQFAEIAAANRPRIRDGLIDSNDLDKVPPPRMLMEEFIPHAAMGFLGGDTGTYKSFVAVSWACHLASGTPWQGRHEFRVPAPVRVLYVAAEGAGGAAQRIEAWKRDHGALPRGNMVLYPRAIDLMSEIAVQELLEEITAAGFGFVVIDTLARSASGSEDNSATEFGIVFNAVAAVRDATEATFLFVDHSGHDGSRIRGTAAKSQNADFVVMATRSGDNGPDSQRTIKITKRKDLVTEGEWDIRLHRVPEVGPQGSAYIELGSIEDDALSALFGGRNGHWWEHDPGLVPDAVASLRGPGADAARDLYRIFAYIDDPDGITFADLYAAYRERPDREPASRSTVKRARALLYEDAKVIEALSTTRYALIHRPEKRALRPA